MFCQTKKAFSEKWLDSLFTQHSENCALIRKYPWNLTCWFWTLLYKSKVNTWISSFVITKRKQTLCHKGFLKVHKQFNAWIPVDFFFFLTACLINLRGEKKQILVIYFCCVESTYCLQNLFDYISHLLLLLEFFIQ